jgi:hypothetical protein
MEYQFRNRTTQRVVQVVRNASGAVWRMTDNGPATITSEAQLAQMQRLTQVWEQLEVPPPMPLDWPNGVPGERNDD